MVKTHTPPAELQKESEINFNCSKCDEADNSQMVHCDNSNCDKWYHYSCVNVTDDIANIPWKCENCEQSTTSNLSKAQIINAKQGANTSSKSSSKSQRSSKRLALKRLEEERILQQQRDIAYLDKKYQLLAECTSSSEEESESNSAY